MKHITNWLKESFHCYCELATMSMDCGLVEPPYQGY